MSTIIPLEKFMCYKDPNGKVNVTCLSKNEDELKLSLDGVYKLTLIKPYTEDGKNPEMELVLDGSTKYNIKYIDSYYDDDDNEIYYIDELENVSFNIIDREDTIYDHPELRKFYKSLKPKLILDEYCQCFDQGFYHKNISEIYNVEPYETDYPMLISYEDNNIKESYSDYWYINEIIYSFALGVKPSVSYDISYDFDKLSNKISNNNFTFNENPKYNNFIFTPREDDDNNIVWDLEEKNIIYIDGSPVTLDSKIINSIDLTSYGIEITGDINEGDYFIIDIDINYNNDVNIPITNIIDIELAE